MIEGEDVRIELTLAATQYLSAAAQVKAESVNMGKTAQDVFARLDTAAQKSGARYQIFGDETQRLASTKRTLEAAINRLINLGYKPESDELQKATALYNQNKIAIEAKTSADKKAAEVSTAHGMAVKDIGKQIVGYTSAAYLAVQAGQALIRGAGELIKTSVTLAASYERLHMEFSVLTGSMEIGNKLFEQMNKLAAQTPLELADITAAGKQLLAVGIPIEEITTKLRMLGDVAMGNAEKLDTLTGAFAQITAKGTANMIQLNRFVYAGVPIMDALGKATGKTADELFKMSEQGEISAALVKQALETLTSEGGLMENMMAKVATTAEGKFSTALDNAKIKLADIGTKALPAVTSALDAFNKAMDKGAKIQNIQDVLKGTIRSEEAVRAAIADINAGIKEIESGNAKDPYAQANLYLYKEQLKVMADLVQKYDFEWRVARSAEKSNADVAAARKKEKEDQIAATAEATDAEKVYAAAMNAITDAENAQLAGRWKAWDKYISDRMSGNAELEESDIDAKEFAIARQKELDAEYAQYLVDIADQEARTNQTYLDAELQSDIESREFAIARRKELDAEYEQYLMDMAEREEAVKQNYLDAELEAERKNRAAIAAVNAEMGIEKPIEETESKEFEIELRKKLDAEYLGYQEDLAQQKYDTDKTYLDAALAIEAQNRNAILEVNASMLEDEIAENSEAKEFEVARRKELDEEYFQYLVDLAESKAESDQLYLDASLERERQNREAILAIDSEMTSEGASEDIEAAEFALARREELDAEYAQYLADLAQQGADTNQAYLDAEIAAERKALFERIDLYNNLKYAAEDASTSIMEGLGVALVSGEDGWKSFARAGLNAFATIIEASAKASDVMVAEAIAASLVGTLGGIPASIAYSLLAHTAAGAIRGIPLAKGGEGWVNSPTPLLVGEGGEPEFVSVTPKSKMGGGGGNYVINNFKYNIAGSVIREREVGMLGASQMARAGRGY